MLKECNEHTKSPYSGYAKQNKGTTFTVLLVIIFNKLSIIIFKIYYLLII